MNILEFLNKLIRFLSNTELGNVITVTGIVIIIGIVINCIANTEYHHNN